ncbi:response regulator [Pontiella sulfatireligans]|uniref:Transcriptional regulatory protein DegU n=1 Tax=Pontiella sulfatireligans TaxID=2750658 RepID=A0A6C2UHZ1_9BACT|nr:response regulator transcription factor [Pontiella sulfatireligans]VGO19748.1 Transcriptional regulatory protein DegU [Pontiella sulfatireligans]
MKKQIKIMLVEDHPEYREILEFVFGKEKGLKLISQFGNAELALRNLQDGGQGTEPDIILLDLNLPGMSGLDAMPWFAKYTPDAKIIILSQSDHEADVLRAIQQGAAGYLLKSTTMDEITHGIRTVMDGGATLEPSLARFILKTLQPRLPKTATEEGISHRELEVLSLIAKGLSQKEISSQLKISTYTVTDHLKHIYEKLNVPNAPSAIDKAHRLGLFLSKNN